MGHFFLGHPVEFNVAICNLAHARFYHVVLRCFATVQNFFIFVSIYTEKRGWVYNGDRMSPAPLKATQSQDILFLMGKHELTRMEALDIPLSPRGIEISPRGMTFCSANFS